jgi:serine/threonine protein phosphatase PrpC
MNVQHEQRLERLKLEAYGCSYIGTRHSNEDAWLVDPDHGLFVVSDGMGGHAGGEVASAITVSTLRRFYERATYPAPGHADERAAEARLDLACRFAHRDVAEQRVGTLADMGATLVALRTEGNLAVIAHAGDSRIYRMRDHQLRQLTRDHSLKEELLLAGNELFARRLGHVVTRAVGVGDRLEPDLQSMPMRSQDRFLLCSDGLSDTLDEPTIARLLSTGSSRDAARALVREASLAARDNTTAVVVTAR